MVAALYALLVGGRRLPGKRDLQLALLQLARDVEAHALEDLDHLAVLGEHDRDEALDAGALGAAGELLQQPRADAAALVLVGHGERRFGRARVAQPRIGRERDDALAALVGKGADQRAVVLPVGI